MERRANTQHIVLILALLTPADTIHFQVSHHPPAAAHHVTSQRGWTLWQHITIDSKFRGKYISVVPLGKKQSVFTMTVTLYEHKCYYIWDLIYKYTEMSVWCFVCIFFTIGNIHLQFHSSGNHYVWSKVTSTVHNIIVGKLWIDQVCSSWTAVRKAFWRSFTFFSLCIRFFVIHLWTSLCSLSCSEEYFLCLFVYSVKMGLWITPG